MSFKSDVVSFEKSVAGGIASLDRVIKLSDARERRALAGRVSVTRTLKSRSDKEIHGLLTQILRIAGGDERARELAPLARRLKRCGKGTKGAKYLQAVAELAEAAALLDKRLGKYSPDQPRDPETGQWIDAWGALPPGTASGIKDVVSGALSGAASKIATGARAVRASVNDAVEYAIATPMVTEALVLATAAAFFFYFKRSASAMQLGLTAIDFALKSLRFLRRIP